MTVEKKLIRLDDAFSALAKINNKPRNEESLIETLLDTCPRFSHKGESYLFMDDLEAFCNNYIKAIREQDSTFLGRERGYKGPLVDIETFLESDDYMGLKGSVRPLIKYELEQIFANDGNLVEVVLAGSTGSGKSFLSRMGLAYLLYKISMLHDPQAEYDLSPGSSIVFILQAVSLRLARKILFEPLMSELAHCKYFKEKFPFNKNITSELQFPNQIFVIPVSGSEMSALGLNVFAGCFLENQEFYSTNNTFEQIGKEGIKSAFRYGNSFCIEKGDTTKPVFTGFKPLVKLTLDNGDTILSTPDQLFLGDNNEGIQAGLCEGRRILFSNLSNMRSRGYVSYTASQTSSSHDSTGIFEIIPRIQNDPKTIQSKKNTSIPNDLSSMRSNYEQNNINTFKETQLTKKGIRGSVWAYNTSYRDRRKENVVSRKYKETENKRPHISSSISKKNRRSVSFSSCSYPNKISRCEGKRSGFYKSKNTMEQLRSTRKKPTSCYWAKPTTKIYSRKSEVFLSGQTRTFNISKIKIRDSYSGVVGYTSNSMGLRNNSTSFQCKTGGSYLHPRLFSPYGITRSKNKKKRRAFLGCNKEDIQSYCNNRQYNKAIKIEQTLQLACSKQNKRDIIFPDTQLFDSRRCIRVESIGILAPVYDLENVGGSHYFLAKTESGLIPAKNCISEINYFNVTLNSKILEARGSTDTTYDQAARTYTNLIQRMKNRFSVRGKVPGLLFLDSAAHYPGDFLSRKIDEAQHNKTIHVMKYAIWDTLPQDRFCGDKFLVEVGGANRQSRIIAHKNMANPESEIIEVPVEYRVDFERDIETALRDFAGIAVGYKHAFMPYKESILEAVKSYESIYNNKTLFRYDTCVINEIFGAGPPKWEEVINQDYLEEMSFNRDSDFALHLDIGISKDCVGLAVGHIQDYKILPSTSYFNKEMGDFVELTDVQAPVICLDGLLEIQPPNNGEIDLDLLRGLCFYLAKILNLKFATLDRFESAIFIQGFRKLHIRSGQVSVVSTPIPYIELKAAYLEGRILHQGHETYIEEMLRLQYDPKKNKIDHPLDFKKDIADAAASVTHILAHKVAQYKRSKKNVIAESRKLQIGGRI